MVYCHLEPNFSPESDVHYVNFRFYSQDYRKCDYMLLLMMRNAINLQTAVITQHCPVASFEYGIVSIKIQGKYDNAEQVYGRALEMVKNWQLENNSQGNFIFDRQAIWWRDKISLPIRPAAPRLPPSPRIWRPRRSPGSVNLNLPIHANALRIARQLLQLE